MNENVYENLIKIMYKEINTKKKKIIIVEEKKKIKYKNNIDYELQIFIERTM